MQKNLSFTSMGDIYRPLFIFSCLSLLTLQVSRLVLIIMYWDRVNATGGLWVVMLQGARFDVITICALVVIPATLHPLLCYRKTWQTLLKGYLIAAYGFLVLMEAATPTFIGEFDLRPNILFVEYLKYPREIIAMLWNGYSQSAILGGGVLIIALWLLIKLLIKPELSASRPSPAVAIILAVAASLICAVGIRSSFGHRPANPALVAFSNDLLVNDLVLSSAYNVIYATYTVLRHESGIETYGSMSQEEALQEVRAAMALPQSYFLVGGPSTYHKPIAQTPIAHRPNLVIILEESLGAEFVGALGGLPLTPNLDRLFSEGIWLTNLYATGTRSARGIEAVMTGFTPTPARSVLKLPKSQTGFFSIAQVLRENGYDTKFMYGGEAHFDNMRQFLVGNGVESVIEEKDFEHPSFKGSWGVSDEDLLMRAHQEFEMKHEKPFFSLVFTSSNHSPFEFPEGKIKLHQEPKAHVNNAVKYADYALGAFFKLAKSSSYWRNTLFLVVADHNSRVWGDDLVPIDRFHVPAVVLGGPVEPMKIERLASQIDLIPTLLGLMGIDDPTPTIGIDLLRPDIDTIPGRAVMQYHKTQAYMQGDNVVIMKLEENPQHYIRSQTGLKLSPRQNPDLIRRALGIATWTTHAYQNRLYGSSQGDSNLGSVPHRNSLLP